MKIKFKNFVESGKLYQYVAGFICTLATFQYGASFGWSSPASSQLQSGENSFSVNSFEFGWIASVLNIGAIVGSLVIGKLIDKYGIRNGMLLLVIPIMLGWVLVIFSQNLAMILIGRTLLGFGGAFFTSCPQYTTEIADVSNRGTLGSFAQLLFMVGVLFSYVIGSVVSLLWMNIICAMTPIVFGALFYLMPQTPSYLLSQNKEEYAIKALMKLRGRNTDLQNEVDDLKSSINKRSENVTWSQIFNDKATVRALIICFGLVFFLQMSGINAVLFYTVDIFDTADVELSSDSSSIIIGAVNILATLFAGVVVDRSGRKILLLISSSLMAISLFALGMFFYLKDTHPYKIESLGWLPLASLSIFAIAFSIGIGPVTWVILGEIFTYEVKTITSPWVVATAWTFSLIVTTTFDTFIKLVGIGPNFWIFCGLTTLSIIFIGMYVPETKGKKLSDIQKILAK